MGTTLCRLARVLLWAAMLAPPAAAAQSLRQAVDQTVHTNPEVLAAAAAGLPLTKD